MGPLLPQDRPTYAQTVAKPSNRPVTTTLSGWEIKQIEKFINSVPEAAKQFMMSPEKYKSKIDAINHVLDITKVLAQRPTNVFKVPRANIHCFYCKKRDHLIKECPVLKAEVYRKNFCRKCKNQTPEGNQTNKPLTQAIPLSQTKTRGGTIFEIFQADTNLNLPKETSV